MLLPPAALSRGPAFGFGEQEEEVKEELLLWWWAVVGSWKEKELESENPSVSLLLLTPSVVSAFCQLKRT